MKEELDRMREAMEAVLRNAEIERTKAETERRNAEYFRELLEREKNKKEDLERQLRLAKHDLMTSCWEPEPMETEEVREIGVPAADTEEMEAEREQERDEGRKENSPKPNPKVTTKEELEQYPALRPAIKGVRTKIEDKPRAGGKPKIIENKRVDIRTMTNEKGQRIAAPIRGIIDRSVKAKQAQTARDTKKKKSKGNQRDPNWNAMELVSSQSEEETERIAEAIGYLKKKGIPVLFEGGDRNMPPPPIRERRHIEPPPPPKTGDAPPPGKGKTSEARRRRKYEKRREKRREEARRRIFAASAPPPHPQ